MLSLPTENELLCEWLKAKFSKGSVPNPHPGSKVSTAIFLWKALQLHIIQGFYSSLITSLSDFELKVQLLLSMRICCTST